MSVQAYMAVLPSLIKRQVEDTAYRIYVTDSLRIIGENTAKFAGGSYMRARYIDIIGDKPKNNRTGEEIAAEVIKKAGLTVLKGGEPY